jgi:hypothetical protein
MRGETVGAYNNLVLSMLRQLICVELAHGKDCVDGSSGHWRPPINILAIMQPNIARSCSGADGDRVQVVPPHNKHVASRAFVVLPELPPHHSAIVEAQICIGHVPIHLGKVTHLRKLPRQPHNRLTSAADSLLNQ